MNKKDFKNRLLVSITGYQNKHWQNKIKEIEHFNIKEVALFLSRFGPRQRKKIYSTLLKSKIKSIPLVHARHDMEQEEFKFLIKNFRSLYFTIHENAFSYLKKWRGFYKYLYLEMNYDNIVSDLVKVKKVGGFCIDLSHFKAAEEKWSKDFEYIIKRKDRDSFFACNHLNGYSYQRNTDLHTVKNLKEFNYLKTLPEFLFGQAIGIEVENSIKQQLVFKKYLVKLLNNLFNKK